MSTPKTLGDWLEYHRKLRDVGSILLLIGVIAEILIDEFWEIPHLPLLRGRKATALLKTNAMFWKRCAMLFVGVGLVAGGITLEWWQGMRADDVADQMRMRLLAAIAPRSLSEADQKEIADACIKVSDHLPVRVVMTRGPQGSLLGIQIWLALKAAGFNTGVPEFTDAFVYEVSVSGPLNHTAALNCVSNALGKKLPIWGLMGILPNGSPIVITVGEREMGKLPE